MSESNAVVQGGCLCGQIRYEIRGGLGRPGVCHCKNCQRQSGSAFSTLAVVNREHFTIVEGEPALYTDNETSSGAKVSRYFCGNCGSPIYSDMENRADIVAVKAGTLDDTSYYKPTYHLWCESRQSWFELAEGLPQLDRQ